MKNIIITLLLFSAYSFSLGQSVKSWGTANTNNSLPEDASTAIINPAGLVHLEEKANITVTGVFGTGEGQFISSDPKQTSRTEPVNTVVPSSFAISFKPSEHIAFGVGAAPLSVGAAFYPEDFSGKFSGLGQEYTFLGANVAGAVKINDWLSIGGKIIFPLGSEYNAVIFQNGYDSVLDLVGSSVSGAQDLVDLFFDPLLPIRAELDGTLGTEANGYGVSAHLSLLNKKLNVSANFTSPIKYSGSGTIYLDHDINPNGGELGGSFDSNSKCISNPIKCAGYKVIHETIQSVINGQIPESVDYTEYGRQIPGNITLSASYQHRDFTFLFKVASIFYDQAEGWTVEGDNPIVGTFKLEEPYKQRTTTANEFGLGVIFRPIDKLNFRAGFNHQSVPKELLEKPYNVLNTPYSTYSFSVGAGIVLKNLEIDLSFLKLKSDKMPIVVDVLEPSTAEAKQGYIAIGGGLTYRIGQNK